MKRKGFLMTSEECLDYLKKVYSTNNFCRLLGLEIESVKCGECVLKMTIDPEKHTNLYGIVHGGALESLADTALGVVCATMGERVMTVNFNMSFIRNIHPGETARAFAKVQHHGRTTMVVSVKLFDEDDKMMGHCTATMFVRGKFPEIPANW